MVRLKRRRNLTLANRRRAGRFASALTVRVRRLMAGLQMIREFFLASEVAGSRSTALQSVLAFFGLLLGGTLVAALAGADRWLVAALAIASGIDFVTFLIAFFYLLAKDPDALRSERFTLQKMALERGLVGDNIGGLVPGSTTRPHLPISGGNDE